MENFGEFVVNHWILWTLFFGLLALIIGATISGSLGVAAISVAQAVQIVNQKKGIFVDTRDQAVFKKEHIADAINIPLSAFNGELEQSIDTSKPIILVAAMGQSTTQAAKYLQQRQVSEIYVLKGGINAWREARMPLFS